MDINTESPIGFVCSVAVISGTVALNAGEFILGSEILTITGKVIELVALVLSSLYLYWVARGKRVKVKKEELEFERMEEDKGNPKEETE